MATQEERMKEFLDLAALDWKGFWAAVGNMGSLTTAATTLVAAINEVKATADAAGGTAADASTTVKGISERSTDAEALALSATDVTLSPSNLGAIANVNNGLVKLDGSGKVAAAQLPSFVDDIVEVANFAALPGTGETGKIYVTLNDNNEWRWGGSAYAEIAASPGSTDEVTEGATNLYFTNTRADGRADGRITALIGDPDADLAAYYTAAKA